MTINYAQYIENLALAHPHFFCITNDSSINLSTFAEAVNSFIHVIIDSCANQYYRKIITDEIKKYRLIINEKSYEICYKIFPLDGLVFMFPLTERAVIGHRQVRGNDHLGGRVRVGFELVSCSSIVLKRILADPEIEFYQLLKKKKPTSFIEVLGTISYRLHTDFIRRKVIEKHYTYTMDSYFSNVINCNKDFMLSADQLIKISRSLLSALIFLNEHRWIHHDIKPENIFFELIEGEIHPKIGDFNLTKKIEYIFTSTFSGTYGYIPLESILGIDIYKDIFALGQTLLWFFLISHPSTRFCEFLFHSSDFYSTSIQETIIASLSSHEFYQKLDQNKMNLQNSLNTFFRNITERILCDLDEDECSKRLSLLSVIKAMVAIDYKDRITTQEAFNQLQPEHCQPPPRVL